MLCDVFAMVFTFATLAVALLLASMLISMLQVHDYKLYGENPFLVRCTFAILLACALLHVTSMYMLIYYG